MKLYRKRIMPKENKLLDKDIIVYIDDEIIVTKWDVINKREDFNKGKSCYYLKEGYKISEFYKDNKRVYVYCDIISWEKTEDSYIFTDLLADVIIENNGLIKVLDLEEISDALDNNNITIDEVKKGLRSLNNLLNKLYSGQLNKLLEPIKNKG